MILNLKPYIEARNNTKAQAFRMGVSTDSTFVDQKRNTIEVLAGYQTIVKVIPQVVGSTSEFDKMDSVSRNCKLSHEVANFSFTQRYTTAGCEFECAAQKAVALCKCIPWYYPSNYTSYQICNMFEAHCFDHVMSDESNYKKCPDLCKETCKDSPMTVATTYLPIDPIEICGKGGVYHDRLTQATRQYYVFENYKALVAGRIPEFKKSMSNGSYCQDFVKKYVAQISVGSSTSSVTKSIRSPRATFIDQLGIIGGNLGLFTGMSIFSIFEVVLFIFKLVLSIFGGFTLKTIGQKFLRLAFEPFDQTHTSKKDQVHQNDNASDEFLREEISALKHKIETMESSFETMKSSFETMELILMSVLPEYKHHQLLQKIDSKPTLARAKNVVEATEDIESNGTKYQQDKKNVSLTRN